MPEGAHAGRPGIGEHASELVAVGIDDRVAPGATDPVAHAFGRESVGQGRITDDAREVHDQHHVRKG